jgi:hypothetical protein
VICPSGKSPVEAERNHDGHTSNADLWRLEKIGDQLWKLPDIERVK